MEYIFWRCPFIFFGIQLCFFGDVPFLEVRIQGSETHVNIIRGKFAAGFQNYLPFTPLPHRNLKDRLK